MNDTSLDLQEVLDHANRLMWWQGFRTNVIVMSKDVARVLFGEDPKPSDEVGVYLKTWHGVPVIHGDEPKMLEGLFPNGHDYSLERDEIWLVDCRFYNRDKKPHKDHGMMRLAI